MILCFLIVACVGENKIPTAFSFATPKPSLTAPPTKISTPTMVQATEPPSTPTFTPFPPYNIKNVVFEYYTVGYLSDFDSFYAGGYSTYPKLVLYEDGQMITNEGQRILSEDEIKTFLSKLDAMGFFSLESNQAYDQEDKLYSFGNQYQKVYDGLRYCILVNADKSRELCAYEPYMQFLIPEMKRILQYLDAYHPIGLTPYYPDRILMSIQPVDPQSDEFSATATPWDNRFPSLDFPPPKTYLYETPASIRFVEGDMAKEIYIFVTNLPSRSVFMQDGKEYIVEVDRVLPHETVINSYQ